MADAMDVDMVDTPSASASTSQLFSKSISKPNGTGARPKSHIAGSVNDMEVEGTGTAEIAEAGLDPGSDDEDGVPLHDFALDEEEEDDFEGLGSDGSVSSREAVTKTVVRLSPSDIPTINPTTDPITTSSITLNAATTSSLLNPQKPTPYIHDPGHLLITDPNPLPALPSTSNPAQREAVLSSVARDAAQSLLNNLLTTCPITTTSSTANSKQETASGSGVLMTLPPPVFRLPREKRVPERKEKTKWERFAEKKGIAGKKKEGKVWDEEQKMWRPRYGYGAKKDVGGQRDWLVEVDEKTEKEGKDPRTGGRAERKEEVKRQARRERRNEARGKRGMA